MSSDIKVQLKEARKLYDSKKYEDSLNLYEKLYRENPDEFNLGNLISYSWAIYQVRVKNFKSEEELLEAAELITDLIPQSDLNSRNTCPYSFSVMEVLKYLDRENQYYNMDVWFEMIDARLLDENKSNPNYRSRRERFYEYASKAYLACAEWQDCIDISKEALNSVKSFTNHGDVWHKWRMAKSFRELNQPREALKYLDEVSNIKDDWFVFSEFAQNYHILDDEENTLKYLSKAILAKGPVKMKVNLYCFAYNILESIDEEIAYRHAELCYLLKLENHAQIPDELEDLMIEADELDRNELIKKISAYWQEFRFRNQELRHGTVTRFFEDKNFGFIKTDDNESVFFHKSEFKADNIHAGQSVSFYIEESFDKVKNEKSKKAVNVRGE